MSDRTRQHFIPSCLLEIMIINFTAYLSNCAKHHSRQTGLKYKHHQSIYFEFLPGPFRFLIAKTLIMIYTYVHSYRRTHACFVVVVVVFTCEGIKHADFQVTPLH